MKYEISGLVKLSEKNMPNENALASFLQQYNLNYSSFLRYYTP